MDSYKQGFADTEKHSAVLVVSSLVALMIDQVKILRSLGVKCSMVTSSNSIERDLLANLIMISVLDASVTKRPRHSLFYTSSAAIT